MTVSLFYHELFFFYIVFYGILELVTSCVGMELRSHEKRDINVVNRNNMHT